MSDSHSAPIRGFVFPAILAGLLFLRLPLLITGQFIRSSSAVISDVFFKGTYLLTCAGIWAIRDRLGNYNLGSETVILLALAPWLEMAGVGCGVVSGLSMRFFGPTAITSRSPVASLRYFIASVSSQFARAATCEEPLFRGFLWGYLRDRDWPERRIFASVAILFWVGHLYYIVAAPISFWFVVPLGSTVLAYLAWRSGTITATMTTHALFNTLGDMVGHFRW